MYAKYMYPNMKKIIVSCMCEYIYICVYVCMHMYKIRDIIRTAQNICTVPCLPAVKTFS